MAAFQTAGGRRGAGAPTAKPSAPSKSVVVRAWAWAMSEQGWPVVKAVGHVVGFIATAAFIKANGQQMALEDWDSGLIKPHAFNAAASDAAPVGAMPNTI